MQKFRLTPSAIKEWELAQWLILAALVSLIAGFSIVIVQLMIAEEMERYALSVSITAAVGISTVSLIYNKDRQLHIHHWVFSIILCAYLCYQNLIVLALHGLLNGIMIEGIARWGLDPVWEPIE